MVGVDPGRLGVFYDPGSNLKGSSMTLASRWVRLAAVACGLFSLAPVAEACSVCGCGDPLLDANDPAATTGALRLQLDTEYLDVTAGNETPGGGTDRLKQYTLKLQVVYSPLQRVSLVASLPYTRKDLSTEGFTASDVSGLGDAEVAARVAIFDLPDFAARRRQTVALSAGTSLPTGSSDQTVRGELIDEHGQLGTGSWGPFAGIHYRFEQDRWQAAASVTGRVHNSNSRDYKYGSAALWSVHGQYWPLSRVALDLGIDGRYAAEDKAGPEIVPHTGGTVLAIAPGAYFNVGAGFWLALRSQIPFYTRLIGDQSIAPTISAGLQYQVF
jgi:hypothetical protein